MEHFLHYIWKFQYFDKTNLETLQGDKLSILFAGFHNQDAGADFEEAIVQIGDIEWRGTIEIDTYGRNWYAHHHNENATYENVVLHVVWKQPKEIRRKDGSILPILVLEDRINQNLWVKYQEFLRNDSKIPCQSHWEMISSIALEKMLERSLSERLIRKASHVLALLQDNTFDWEETAYQILLEHFGFKKNNETFLNLSKNLPFKIIQKHSDQVHQVEALVFGMAGFLEDNIVAQYHIKEEEEKKHIEKLQREFRFLSHKYDLKDKILNNAQWKFLRLRPANFPTVRLAQVVALLAQQQHLCSVILNATTLKEFHHFFDANLPPYWQNHFHFAKQSKTTNKSLGKSAIENLIINVVIPIRIAHSLYRQKEDILAKKWLYELKSEQNSILSLFKPLEKQKQIKFHTAAQSQAILELYSQYCLPKRCLTCEVGKAIFVVTTKEN